MRATKAQLEYRAKFTTLARRLLAASLGHCIYDEECKRPGDSGPLPLTEWCDYCFARAALRAQVRR